MSAECLGCGVELPTRWKRLTHNSLWTSYSNTCRGVVSAERIAFLAESIAEHERMAAEWVRISNTYGEAVAARDAAVAELDRVLALLGKRGLVAPEGGDGA